MLEVLQQSLVVLANQELVRHDEGYPDKLRDCRERIMQRFQPIPGGAIPSLMHAAYRGRGDLVGDLDRWLFLPAVTKGAMCIPVLNVIWDYRDAGSPDVGFQIALFTPNGVDEPLARVWRFETPEGPGRSRHGYHHAQPSRTLRTWKMDDVEVSLADESVDDGYPTIPIPAENPAELLVCVLLSVYGAFEARNLVEDSGDPRLIDPLRKLLSW